MMNANVAVAAPYLDGSPMVDQFVKPWFARPRAAQR